MKAIVLYHPSSDHARMVEEFAHDFQRAEASRRLELVSVDTKDGASLAELYGITQYPAVLALADDGRLLNVWSDKLPLMNEVAAYTHNS